MHFYHKCKVYVPTMLFAALIGTYLDLFFVEKNLYSFPTRPFPDLFSINIAFTLFVLPIFTAIYIYVLKRVNILIRIGMLLTLSLAVAFFESYSVQLGLFTYSAEWNSIYSSFGYVLFILILWKFHDWMSSS
ncbi:CBO0543 family protein [Halalkalibacter kiskunsagensis]|uniref:CBO0543 family protein n=1 Tax=Halalkalibacter kiskunsagensis TaxID=1548599 RepID=A0ABV6KHH2_9BACI